MWSQDTGVGRLICRLTTHVGVETVDGPGLSWYQRVTATLVDEVLANSKFSSFRRIWSIGIGVKRRALIINTVECELLEDEIFQTSYGFCEGFLPCWEKWCHQLNFTGTKKVLLGMLGLQTTIFS